MESIMPIKNKCKEILLSPNNRKILKIEYYIHDSRLGVISHLLIRKIMGSTEVRVGSESKKLKLV